MYASDGLLSVLDRSRRPRQARWLPALDTQNLARRENKQEDYWPVGVNDKVAHVIILKVRRIAGRELDQKLISTLRLIHREKRNTLTSLPLYSKNSIYNSLYFVSTSRKVNSRRSKFSFVPVSSETSA